MSGSGFLQPDLQTRILWYFIAPFWLRWVTDGKRAKSGRVHHAPIPRRHPTYGLDVRGPAPTDHVFTFRHRPLSASYCYGRLRTYGGRCGLHVTPHQLRHSAATLLLNAGAPILTVQAVLGHKHIDTTLGYARLYDGTVAADYYRAMDQVEARMALAQGTNDGPPTGGQLLALVDALHDGTLNEDQRETVHALRLGILALAEAECEVV